MGARLGERSGGSLLALPSASFIVNGAAPVHNSALASVGAEIKLRNRWDVLAKFNGDFANRSQTYAGLGSVRPRDCNRATAH